MPPREERGEGGPEAHARGGAGKAVGGRRLAAAGGASGGGRCAHARAGREGGRNGRPNAALSLFPFFGGESKKRGGEGRKEYTAEKGGAFLGGGVSSFHGGFPPKGRGLQGWGRGAFFRGGSLFYPLPDFFSHGERRCWGFFWGGGALIYGFSQTFSLGEMPGKELPSPLQIFAKKGGTEPFRRLSCAPPQLSLGGDTPLGDPVKVGGTPSGALVLPLFCL